LGARNNEESLNFEEGWLRGHKGEKGGRVHWKGERREAVRKNRGELWLEDSKK